MRNGALKVGNPYLARKFARFFRAPSTVRDFMVVRAPKVGNPYLARKFARFFRAPLTIRDFMVVRALKVGNHYLAHNLARIWLKTGFFASQVFALPILRANNEKWSSKSRQSLFGSKIWKVFRAPLEVRDLMGVRALKIGFFFV